MSDIYSTGLVTDERLNRDQLFDALQLHVEAAKALVRSGSNSGLDAAACRGVAVLMQHIEELQLAAYEKEDGQ